MNRRGFLKLLGLIPLALGLRLPVVEEVVPTGASETGSWHGWISHCAIWHPMAEPEPWDFDAGEGYGIEGDPDRTWWVHEWKTENSTPILTNGC